MQIIDDSILFKSHEKYNQFQFKDIFYCESDGSYTDFYLENGTTTKVCSNLKLIDNELSKHGFMRVHNRLLINKSKVKSFSSRLNIVRIVHFNLPISRKYKTKVIMELLKNKIPDIKNSSHL